MPTFQSTKFDKFEICDKESNMETYELNKRLLIVPNKRQTYLW